MERYNGSELIWLVNEKTKDCDVLKIEKDFALSLISKEKIKYSNINKNYFIYTTSGIFNYLGLEENNYLNQVRIEKLYKIFTKALNSFKQNDIKFLVNEKDRTLNVITISKKDDNAFCYDLISGKKFKGNIIFSDDKNNWDFVPKTDCKVYSFENAKKYILDNKKIYALGIISIMKKKFLDFEEVKKFKNVFEKSLESVKKNGLNKDERSL